MTKKVTNVIVLVALIVVLVAGLVVALVLSNGDKEYTFEEGNFEFVKKGDIVAIAKYHNVDKEDTVKLPVEVQGYVINAIGKEAFKGDEYLRTIELGDNITLIEDGAFAECENLSTVKMSRVTAIGNGAFKDDSMLSSVQIPESLVSIGSEAFMNCAILRELNIEFNSDFTPKSNLASVGANAFKGSRLNTVVIPSSMKEIGERAFADAALFKIVFYDGVEVIGKEAFTYADNGGNTMNIYTYRPALNDGTYSPSYANITLVSEQYKLPDSVRVIGEGAFEKTNFEYTSSRLSIGTLEVGANVESIGARAFRGAYISRVSFKNENTTLGAYAFSEIGTQIDFSFPAKIKEIPEGLLFRSSFRNANTMIIPESVTSIGSHAFSGSGTKYTIEFAEGSPMDAQYKMISGNGYNALVSKDGKVLYSVIMSSSSSEYIIPEGVEVIDSYAFTNVGANNYDDSLTIDIPASVKEIRANAFSDARIFSFNMMHAGTETVKVDVKAFENINTKSDYVVRVASGTALYNSMSELFKGTANVNINTLR